MHPTRIVFPLIALSLLAAAGCATPPAVAQSQVARDKTPSAPAGDVAQLAAGDSAFAFALYQTLRQPDGNLFFSPYSLSAALAMAYAGAQGNTQSQMAQALHFTLAPAALHPAFNALDLSLNSGGSGSGPNRFTLRAANSLWAQQDFTFLPAFLDVLGRNYGAGLRLVDFINDARREQARQAINAWVSAQTEQKIPQLIGQGVLNGDTRLVLADAIYFKGDWLAPFDPDSAPAPFTRLDGSQVNAPLMHQHGQIAYASGPDFQAVELPYQGGRASLVLLLPPANQFAAFDTSLSAERAAGITAALKPTDVELYLPRFKFDTSLSLADALKGLGMGDAFDPGLADFSAATGKRDLYITHVIHKAYVAVDEKGTEAAAASGVTMGITSVQVNPQPVVVRADHPFVFFIRDQQTGTILFVGRVVDPS